MHYTLVLVDSNQLSPEQNLDLINGAGTLCAIDFSDREPIPNDDELDTIKNVFESNERFKKELLDDHVRGDDLEITEDEEL